MSAITAAEALYEVVDERTLEILEHRRRTAVVRRRGWLVRRALLVADLIGLAVAFVVAQQVYSRTGSHGALDEKTEFLAFVLSLPLWVVAAKLYGLYDRDEEHADHSTADEFVRLFHLITVCTFGLFAFSHVTHLFRLEFSKLLLFWLLAIVASLALRGTARAFCRRQIDYLQNTLIIGAGRTGQALASKLLKHPEYGLNLVGFVDSNPMPRSETLEHLTVLGGLDDLDRVVDLLDVERVIVAFTADPHELLLETISPLRRRDVQIDIVPRLFENLGPGISLHPVEGIQLVGLPPTRLSRSNLIIKRALDIAVASAAVLLLLPAFALITLIVKCDSRGPAFYRHTRIGRGGKAVRIIKFRTMYLDMCRGAGYGGGRAEEMFAELMADPRRRAEFEKTYKLRDDPRVTRLGAFLRRTSLDELPQLWNVLRGDLSLVGPRALTSDELERYYQGSAELLLSTRPGVTGYWQVNGRSQLDYTDRVRLDLAYLSGWSLGLDLRILLKTIRTLVSRAGAY